MNRSSILILAVLSLMAACSATKPKEGQLPNPPQRLKVAGLSFMPPAEDNWWIGTRTPERLMIGRVGRLEGDTQAVEAGTIPIERPATSLDRNRQMKALRERGVEPPRFRIRAHELSDGRVGDTLCAVSYMLVEDRNPEGGVRTLNVVLVESLSMLCPHPANPRIGSMLTYTHRSYPEDRDRVFKDRAAAVLDTFEFEDL
jgi:hypothetical protein